MRLWIVFLLFQFVTLDAFAKVVRYELNIENKPLNLSGKAVVNFALTVNGTVPAPTLEFVEGDEAEITVRNKLQGEEVSIHWHGLLLPPEEDGVAYVNTPPIHPGQERVFKFKLRQSGTFWYHSHTALQEQKGIFGAFVIHPRKKTFHYDRDLVLVISDWSDENPDAIMRNLRKDGDYYLYKKGTVRSYFEAYRLGKLQNQLANEWTRMGGMDLSDVGYDAFLLNGKKEWRENSVKAGEKVRLRVINAAASSYFHLSMNSPLVIVSADGGDVEPLRAQEVLIGMAETYDFLFEVPFGKQSEFRASAQDGTGFASAWIGSPQDEKELAKPFVQADLYALMDHTQHEGHTQHEAEVVALATVNNLKSLHPTDFPRSARVHEIELKLGGDMERYIWHLNGKAIHQDRILLIREGEVVRFKLTNQTMMHHPMHFHGHFFRVLNEAQEKSPLKHTVDVPPHQSRTVEFYANEPGQWMLHCHNLYHMKTGMARVVRYQDFQMTESMKKFDLKDPHLHDHLYSYSELEGASNHLRFQGRLMRTWDEIEFQMESADLNRSESRISKNWETEGDLFYRRWQDNFLNFFGGASVYDEQSYGAVGVGYILPLLFESQLSLNQKGQIRLDLEKRFQWTQTFYSDVEMAWRPGWDGDRDWEYEVSLMYWPDWNWSVGLMLTEIKAGVGAQIRF